MNRTAQAGEILDYDPEIESYLEEHVGRVDGGNRRGKAVFGLMLVSGVGLLWFYGGLARLSDSAWLKTRYDIIGQSIPAWMGLTVLALFLLVVIVSRRRRKDELAISD